MKRCSECGADKELEAFNRDASKRDGLDGRCKRCACARTRRYYEAHADERREYMRRYQQEHADEVLERNRRYRQANQEVVAERERAYREKNKEARAAHRRQYVAENADAIAKQQRRYKQGHPQAILKYKRRYYQEHAEETRERNRRYNQTHPGRGTSYAARYRAAKLGVLSEPYTRAGVFSKTDAACYSCGTPITYDRFVADHVVPLQPQEGEEQGTDLLDNLMPQCFACSSRKCNRPPTEALFVELRARRAADDERDLTTGKLEAK